jgi:fengycin family lipopeptide synthetase D
LGLASRNIAVLRYEKRTNKRFKYFTDYTVYDEFYEDAVEAVKFLRKTETISVSDIFLVGHCRGGWLLPGILERREMEGIAGGVIMSAPNPQVSAVEMIMKKNFHSLPADEMKICREQLEMLHSNRYGQINREAFILAPSLAWWDSLKDFVPGESRRFKDFPTLVLQGGRDINVSGEDFKKWKEFLSENGNASFSYYKSLNHGYVEGEGPGSMEEYLVPGNVPEYVVEEIESWLKAKISVVN